MLIPVMVCLSMLLVTGASSGFGREMTELVLKKGNIAVATARKPETLDVSKSQEIKEVFVQISETFGRLDVVFNNAGYAFLGEVEATPEDAARAMSDTNFWGATNISREAVKFSREMNKPIGGRLVVNSSEAGFHAMPGLGFYSSSKHGRTTLRR